MLFFPPDLYYRNKIIHSNGAIFTRCLPIAFTFLNDFAFMFRFFLKTLRCAPGNVECSFDNRAEKFFVQNPKNFCSQSENQKKIKKRCKRCFPSKCSPGHVECNFDNCAERFLLKFRNFLAQIPKIFIKS